MGPNQPAGLAVSDEVWKPRTSVAIVGTQPSSTRRRTKISLNDGCTATSMAAYHGLTSRTDGTQVSRSTNNSDRAVAIEGVLFAPGRGPPMITPECWPPGQVLLEPSHKIFVALDPRRDMKRGGYTNETIPPDAIARDAEPVRWARDLGTCSPPIQTVVRNPNSIGDSAPSQQGRGQFAGCDHVSQ